MNFQLFFPLPDTILTAWCSSIGRWQIFNHLYSKTEYVTCLAELEGFQTTGKFYTWSSFYFQPFLLLSDLIHVQFKWTDTNLSNFLTWKIIFSVLFFLLFYEWMVKPVCVLEYIFPKTHYESKLIFHNYFQLFLLFFQ